MSKSDINIPWLALNKDDLSWKFYTIPQNFKEK